MARKDIAIGDDGDLVIKDGDFVIAPSDQQHIEDIIQAQPGWWKEFSQVGVGIDDYQQSTGKMAEIASKIKLQLQADGYIVENPNITQAPDGTLTIQPNAYRND